MKKLNLYYVGTHILFWSGYAIAWSYTAVYLQERGYGSQVVGLVTGIGAVISVLLQPLLAKMIAKNHRMSNLLNVLLLKMMAIVMAVLMLFQLSGAYTVAFLFTGVAALDATIPSILNSIAMEANNAGGNINYGFARGMGSVGYALFSLFLGWAVSFFGAECLMLLYIGVSVITLVMVFLLKKVSESLLNTQVREHQKNKLQQDKGNDASMFSLFQKYSYLKYFLLATVLLFMSHNMVCVFLPMIIENAGGDSSKLGVALAISATVEFPVMSYFVKLSKKIKTEKLLIISAVFFAIKSGVALLASTVSVVYLAQFLQFGGFALYIPASVYFIDMALGEEDRNVGQALTGACSLGLGGTFGNVLGGVILEHAGLNMMLVVSTIFCMAAIVFMMLSRESYLKANLKKV